MPERAKGPSEQDLPDFAGVPRGWLWHAGLAQPTGVPGPWQSHAFLLLCPLQAMLMPTTGTSTFWSEGSSLWSSAMEPPSQNSRKRDCLEEQL